MRHSLLRHMEIAIEIGLYRHIEMAFREIGEIRRMPLKGGIVDEHIDAAEPADSSLNRLAAEGSFGHIAAHGDAAPAFGFDSRCCLFGITVFTEINYRDIGPFPCKEYR